MIDNKVDECVNKIMPLSLPSTAQIAVEFRCQLIAGSKEGANGWHLIDKDGCHFMGNWDALITALNESYATKE